MTKALIDSTDEGGIEIAPGIRVARDDLMRLVEAYHIRKLGVFGSAARGGLRPDSDIDLLVEFEPGSAPSFWQDDRLQQAFSHLFGDRPVDIVPPEVLRNPFRRRAIEKDLKVIFDEAART